MSELKTQEVFHKKINNSYCHITPLLVSLAVVQIKCHTCCCGILCVAVRLCNRSSESAEDLCGKKCKNNNHKNEDI